jgi:outer membrane protein TolC
MALKNDVLQVQVNLSNLQQSAADVQSAIDISNYNMNVMLGLPDTTKIEIVDAGLDRVTSRSFNLQNGLLTALQRDLEIKAADVRLGISHKALKIARGYYSPVASVVRLTSTTMSLTRESSLCRTSTSKTPGT